MRSEHKLPALLGDTYSNWSERLQDAKRTHDALRVWCENHGTPLKEQSRCGEDIVLWADIFIEELRKERNEWQGRWSETETERVNIRAERDELQAIVAKLPKCWRLDEAGKLVQDCVVLPKMILWYDDFSKAKHIEVVSLDDYD